MDRNRLIKLLGMTGSTHVGEAANAAWMAGKLLREANLTWDDVICPPTQPKYQERTWERDDPGPRQKGRKKKTAEHARNAACIILASDKALTSWERKFLTTMSRVTYATPKQLGILMDICRKYGFL